MLFNPIQLRCIIFTDTNELIGAFSTVFFVFALGFGVQRLRPMAEETLSDLSRLVIDVLLPFYLFFNISSNASLEDFGKAPVVFFASVLIPVVTILIARLIHKPLQVPENRKTMFSYAAMIGNTALLGIPICESLFGPTAAFHAVIFNFGQTIVAFTIGVWLLSGKGFNNWRSILLNPLVLSVVLGLVVSATTFEFPLWLMRPLSTIGTATLPIALLVAGAQIGSLEFRKSSFTPDLFAVVLLRLFLVPLLVVGVFLLIGKVDLSGSVIIMQAGMPVALTTTIMAKRFQADAQFAASATLFSTLFSLITLPLLALLVISMSA